MKRLREALVYLTLPAEERVRLADAATGGENAPAWLDDSIWAEAIFQGLISQTPTDRAQRGDVLGTDLHGHMAVVTLTVVGKAWLAATKQAPEANA